MLLLIDAGNTLIKWAIVPAGAPVTTEQASWLRTGEVPHREAETLQYLWQQILVGQSVKRVLVSNVAGNTAREQLSILISKLQPQPASISWFVSVRSLAGVTNSYADFSRLGGDRFASLVGARALFPDENLVIVTCGTATTIDTLTSDGTFIGGMILPGLRLMANSLFSNTAQLPDIGQMTEDIPTFATDTISAIRNGCMTAQAGAIGHAVTVHAGHLNNVRCILSGGAAKLVMPYLSIRAQIVDNLVLVGLHAADADKHASDTLC